MRHTILRPSTVVGLVYLALLVVFVTRYNYSAFDFIHLGTVWGKGDPSGTWGYDGQFYYQIALNPFHAAQYLDNTPYRYQRILYPLLARLLSGGQPYLLPYTLLFVNWISIIASVELLSRLLLEKQLNVWLSLGYGGYFGLATALTFDTAEPFTYFLVCCGIFLFEKKRLFGAAAVFGLASLSRETAILFPLGYLMFFLIKKEWLNLLKFTTLSIVPLIIWLMIIWTIFGQTGLTFNPPFEHIPFAGIFAHAQAPRKFWLLILLMLFPTILAWLLIGRALIKIGLQNVGFLLSNEANLHTSGLPRMHHPILFAWIANTILLTFLSRLSFLDLVACSRIATGMILAGIAYGIIMKDKIVLYSMGAYALTFFVYIAGVLLKIESLIIH